MGWDSNPNWASKADVVLDQMAMYTRSLSFTVVDFKSTKSGLWVVVQSNETGKRGLLFDLIEKYQGEWAVKSMSEDVGPYYYDCPKSLISLVPEDNCFTYNASWRRAREDWFISQGRGKMA